MVCDSSELAENEVKVDYLEILRETLLELKDSKLKTNTPELYLGLLGEFAFSRWLDERTIKYDHRTRTNSSELAMDLILYGAKDGKAIRVDVKTSGIRPPKVSRIISVDQFVSIPEHSDILI